MIDSAEWLRVFITHYPLLQYLVIFFVAAFGGEVGMIALSFLAAHKLFPFWPFFILSFVGVIFSDTIWFFMGRTKIAEKIFSHRYANDTVFIITEAIRKISRGNHLLALIFTKFLIGTRVVLIFYISRTKMAFENFIYDDIVAILVWLVVLIPIGFLSGLGFTYISDILESIYAGIGFVLLVLIVVVILQIWLKRVFTKEGKEILEKENMI